MAEYIVRQGDTLWDIAARTLGSGSRWRELGYTGNPRTLPIGTPLTVPDTAQQGQEQEAVQQAPTETVDEYLASSEEILESIVPIPVAPIDPFSFDEELARAAVESEVSPYYEELLGDYLSNVETRKTRAEEDERSQLGLLGEQDRLFREDLNRDYNIAIEKTRQGFAGRNLYFSGKETQAEQRVGTEKTAREDRQQVSQDYRTNELQTGGERFRTDIATEESQRRRDIGREQDFQIERGVLGRRGEQLEEYTTGAIPAYYGESGFGFNNTL